MMVATIFLFIPLDYIKEAKEPREEDRASCAVEIAGGVEPQRSCHQPKWIARTRRCSQIACSA
jgi:hypothetical protein